MHSITDWLQHASAPMVYAVVGALVFCEDALFFGFVLPGETAVVLGGVVASQGHVSVYWLCVVVVLCAVLGDSVGYEVGARLGPRILQVRFLRSHQERVASAQDLIRRRGPAAVFLGRFIAFFRAMMPALAGISRMPYRVFLPFNAAGGLVWGVGFTLLGYFAGTAYKRVERTAGTAVAIAVAAIVVVALVVWEVRRHRAQAEREKSMEASGKSEASEESGEPAEPVTAGTSGTSEASGATRAPADEEAPPSPEAQGAAGGPAAPDGPDGPDDGARDGGARDDDRPGGHGPAGGREPGPR